MQFKKKQKNCRGTDIQQTAPRRLLLCLYAFQTDTTSFRYAVNRTVIIRPRRHGSKISSATSLSQSHSNLEASKTTPSLL